MRPYPGIAGIGAALILFLIFITYMTYDNEPFKALEKAMIISLSTLGVFIMLLPIKGFWDVTVDGDMVISSRLWIIKKKVWIADIDYCIRINRGILIYSNGSPLFGIDGISTNIRNFEKRMRKENVAIEEKGIHANDL